MSLNEAFKKKYNFCPGGDSIEEFRLDQQRQSLNLNRKRSNKKKYNIFNLLLLIHLAIYLEKFTFKFYQELTFFF